MSKGSKVSKATRAKMSAAQKARHATARLVKPKARKPKAKRDVESFAALARAIVNEARTEISAIVHDELSRLEIRIST